MYKFLTSTAALMLTTSVVSAGGLDRSGNSYGILFDDGNKAELSFSIARPDVSGDYPAMLGGGSTGNMAEDYTSLGIALKYAVNDDFDVGLFLNQPYGANAAYGQGAYTGLGADWSSNQISVVGKYSINENFSVYGGLRSVESEANITIPDALIRGGLADAAAAGSPQATALLGGSPAGSLAYTAETEADRQTSYIAGVAYERPEIALRVALTYETGFTHKFATTESIGGPAAGVVNGTSVTEIEIPDAITLDFQSGVAAGTLVFGSIRHAEWSVWDVRPAGYLALTGGSVTGLDNDVTTYRIGVGRQINDDLSVFARYTYEEASGGVASRLAPTDGSQAIGVGGSYSMDQIEITGGIEYITVGDATDGSGVEFADNSAVGFGVTVGYSF